MDGIQFIAKLGEWIAVRKLKIEEKTEPLTVIEFLAGLSVSFDKKIEEFLGKEIDISRLNNVLEEELSELGKGVTGISQALAKVNGIKVNRIINELCEKPNWQKKEKNELKEFCKVFALRKAFKKAGLKVDYSTIETPSIKAAMKQAKKINK